MGRMGRWELANDKNTSISESSQQKVWKTSANFGIEKRLPPISNSSLMVETFPWKSKSPSFIQSNVTYCTIWGYQKDNPTNNAPCYTSHGAPQGCRSCLPHPEAQGWCSQRWPKHTSRQGKPERDSRPRLTPFLDVDPRGCGGFAANSFIHLSPPFLCSLAKYPNFPGLQSSLAPQFGHFKSPPPLASDRSTWIWT